MQLYVILLKNELQRLDLSMGHRDKQKTVFLCLLWLEEKKRTKRTYVHKSWYVKHCLGYCDLIYYKWQRHDYRNPTKKHCRKSLTWYHCLKSYNKYYDTNYPAGKSLFSASKIRKSIGHPTFALIYFSDFKQVLNYSKVFFSSVIF